MEMATEDKAFLTVTEAAEAMGCTVSYIRRLLRAGELEGQKFGPRSWMVARQSALEHRKVLSPRAVGHRETVKKAAKRRK
jgi:excisionase family DNA binding protein